MIINRIAFVEDYNNFKQLFEHESYRSQKCEGRLSEHQSFFEKICDRYE